MKTKPIRVLVADDEPAMRRGICASLSARGYALGEARTGEEAVLAVREQPADVVLLDINMPGIGGIEACRRIRSSWPGIGIVMITVRDSEEDTVAALEAGADDYVTKPFRSRELLARIGAVVRRARGEEAAETSVLRAGKLEMDAEHRTLRKSGEEIHLSPIEFNLLRYFMENRDVPLEHAKLLRRKIEDDPARPEYITTEPWLGCRFRDPAEANPKATAPNENG